MLQSKLATKILIAIVIIVAALAIFQAGLFVGYQKAEFSCQLGGNYSRVFGGPKPGIMGFFDEIMGDDLPNANGVVGKIIAINLPSVMIEDRHNVEISASITDDTVIRKFKEKISPQDLKAGDSVIIIGPTGMNAEIEAKLIRIIPALTGLIGTTTATTSPTK